jgi:ribosomal protein S18 acetylase RimI-like enzyme
MVSLRPLRWPNDRAALCALDVSFTTDRIYQVVATERSFVLEETVIAPPLHKVYTFDDDMDSLPAFTYIVVAEIAAAVVGVATLRVDAWNRRAVLGHLLIDAPYRGRGIGRALIADVVQAAQERQARCLWLETQNNNYGAIQFYQRLGFRCCGLDMALYDSDGSAAGETAVFFVRDLA